MNIRLKELKEKRGISTMTLSKISGVSESTILRLETQKNIDVDTEVLVQLADALNVSVKELSSGV